MRPDALRRPLLLAVVAALSGSALVAIIGLVSGEFGDTQLRIILTTVSLALAGLLALPGTLLLDQRRLRLLAAADLALTAAALGAVLFLIWAQWEDASGAAGKAFVVSVAFAAAAGQASAVESRRAAADSRLLTGLAVLSHGTVVVVACMVAAAVLAEIDDNDAYYRALGAVAVTDFLFVTLRPVIRRFGGAPSAPVQIICVLERPPERLPEDGYRARADAPDVIECAVRARDFASAAATAIRELERRGVRVVRVERAPVE